MHTPTPWAKNSDGFLAGSNGQEVVFSKRQGFIMGDHSEETGANTAFVIRACNSHEDLVACCEQLAKWIKDQGHEVPKQLSNALAKARE